MTEAGWTADKPNASGWYWNRINGPVGSALIMRRDCQLYAWLKFKDAWLSREGWLDYIHGEWLGPITPESYQHGRAAGARECVEKVRARAALWRAHGGAKIGFPYGHLTVEGECDSIADELGKFARQAQDEKGVGNANIKMS